MINTRGWLKPSFFYYRDGGVEMANKEIKNMAEATYTYFVDPLYPVIEKRISSWVTNEVSTPNFEVTHTSEKDKVYENDEYSYFVNVKNTGGTSEHIYLTDPLDKDLSIKTIHINGIVHKETDDIYNGLDLGVLSPGEIGRASCR